MVTVTKQKIVFYNKINVVVIFYWGNVCVIVALFKAKRFHS